MLRIEFYENVFVKKEFQHISGLEMVLENNEDLMTEEMDKMKTKLRHISKALDTQQQLLRLIVQVGGRLLMFCFIAICSLICTTK